MALKGNLRDFSITQLLNLISLAKKSGGLHIEGVGDVASVFFREGRLAYSQIGSHEKALLQLIVENKRISPAQYSLLAHRLIGLNDKEAGLFLMNGSYVNQGEIFIALENYYSEQMRRLFTWTEGYFHFEAGELAPDEKIPTRLPLENLIVEGAREMHELEELKAEIPSLQMALKFTDRPEMNIKNVDLTTEEWKVVSYVNPKNTIQQIARATKMDDLEIRRIVYALLQAGLVEIIRPDGMPIPVKGKTIQPFDNKQQSSLVNRLIERIRSI
jgi:hypothetical protein